MQLCSERVCVIASGCTSVSERGLIPGGRGDEVELWELHVRGDVDASPRRPLVQQVVAGVAD
jgi:hypothetical protein